MLRSPSAEVSASGLREEAAAVAELGSGIAEVFEALEELQSGSSVAAELACCQMEMDSAVPGSQSAVVASVAAGNPSIAPA